MQLAGVGGEVSPNIFWKIEKSALILTSLSCLDEMFFKLPLFQARSLPSTEKFLAAPLSRLYRKIDQNERLTKLKEARVFLSMHYA